jgi:hypothetical protein
MVRYPAPEKEAARSGGDNALLLKSLETTMFSKQTIAYTIEQR